MYSLLHKVVDRGPVAKLESVTFDFSRLFFIDSVGVTCLSNLCAFLLSRKVKVIFTNFAVDKPSVRYLDSFRFFERFLNKKLFLDENLRETTMPLARLQSAESHAWLSQNLMPWIAHKVNMPDTALGSIKTSLQEVINNIQDHSGENNACIHAQWHPKDNCIKVSISDFGIGIPTSMRQRFANLQDQEAILKALTYGVTSKPGGKNAGAGLAVLLQCVVSLNRGEVYIHSNFGVYEASRHADGSVHPSIRTAPGYYPGTLVHVVLRTNSLIFDDLEREDLEW